MTTSRHTIDGFNIQPISMYISNIISVHILRLTRVVENNIILKLSHKRPKTIFFYYFEILSKYLRTYTNTVYNQQNN